MSQFTEGFREVECWNTQAGGSKVRVSARIQLTVEELIPMPSRTSEFA